MKGKAHTECRDFEARIKEHLKLGREKLLKELDGTREAIKIIAWKKTRDFIQTMDKELDKTERKYLADLMVSSMYRSFCYGYGVGKLEGMTNDKSILHDKFSKNGS